MIIGIIPRIQWCTWSTYLVHLIFPRKKLVLLQNWFKK